MYQVGDAVPLHFQVANPQQSLVDATVTLTVDRPDGTPVTLTPTHPGTGQYTALYVPTQAGRHVVRWSATGTADRAEVDVLNVSPVTAPAAIISLAQARDHVNLGEGDSRIDDEELRVFIAAASREVEKHTGLVIARRTIVEEHTVCGARHVALRAAPVLSLTSVATVDGTYTWDVTTLGLDGPNGIVTVPGADMYADIRFTVVAGMPIVPEDYQLATAIICAHLWQSQRTLSVGPTPGGFGGMDVAPAGLGRGYLVPHQAAELLGGRAPNMP